MQYYCGVEYSVVIYWCRTKGSIVVMYSTVQYYIGVEYGAVLYL